MTNAPRFRRRRMILALSILLGGVDGHAADENEAQFDGQVEVLYRSVNVNGSEDKYNYDFAGLDSGTRLGTTWLQWQDADASFLDFARVDMQGLGGDPFQYAGLELGRKDRYELSFTYSKQRYVYDLFDITGDLDGNAWNTENQRTGIDLTLNVTPSIDVLVQYHDQQRAGPGREIRRVRDGEFFVLDRPIDFRVRRYGAGIDATVGPTRIYFLQEYRRYGDEQDFLTSFNTGLNTANTTTIDSLTWLQSDKGSANLTTFQVLTPLGKRVNLAASFYGTLIGDEEIRSRVTQNGSGTDAAGLPWSWVGGFADADIDQKTLLGEIDLSIAVVRSFGIQLQFRSLSQDAQGDGSKDLTGTGTITPQSSSYDYSLQSATILLEGQPTGRFKVTAGYRLTDRDLTRAASRSTSGERNEEFESNGDGSAVLGFSWRPLGWMHFQGQYEKGEIERPFTTISPYEVDHGRLMATFDMPADTHLSLSYSRFHNRQDVLQYGSDATSDLSSISFWQNVGERYHYLLRYSIQDVDTETRTATSLDPDTLILFRTDNTSILAQFDGQVTERWSFWVRLLETRSDGSNPFEGAVFQASVSVQDAQFQFDQKYRDGEAGLKYQFAGGPFVGFSLRAFDYDDPFFSQTDYDGVIGTVIAGFRF